MPVKDQVRDPWAKFFNTLLGEVPTGEHPPFDHSWIEIDGRPLDVAVAMPLSRRESSDDRLVFLLKPGTTFEDFQRIADLYRWRIVKELPSDAERTAYEQIRVTPDGSTTIHYLADPLVRERFLVVRGPQTGAVAFNAGRSFDCETPDEVIERVRDAGSDKEKAGGAYQLAVVFPDVGEEAMSILRRFYETGSSDVRHAVINAVGWRGWPQGKAFLEQVARDDPDSELRENARDIVATRWA
jgi:hypothetical protein